MGKQAIDLGRGWSRQKSLSDLDCRSRSSRFVPKVGIKGGMQ